MYTPPLLFIFISRHSPVDNLILTSIEVTVSRITFTFGGRYSAFVPLVGLVSVHESVLW